MIQTIKAVLYAALHPNPVYLTVVRRYRDAQHNFIGELYLGAGRTAKMIGWSCDNLPFDAGEVPMPVKPFLEFRRDFTDPMQPNTLRVGAMEPSENEAVRRTIALRRYCRVQVAILNRFVEAAMEGKRG